jgi:hypothetical protein
MDDDPGWTFRWSSILLVLVPQLAIRRLARGNTDPLVALRSLFLSFCAAIFAISIVALVLGDITKGSVPSGVAIVLVVVAGCISLLAQRYFSRPLDCTSLGSLAASYRTRFFVRLALSDAAALVGFMFDIAVGPWWVYFIGAGFAVVGLWRLAPTRGHLAQDQASLSSTGCRWSLTEALRTPSSAGPSPQFR